MEKFTVLKGIAAALPQANLDTDQLMPKQFLRGIDRRGLSNGVLYDLRFASPGQKRPDFILNRAPWTDASILVVGPNFGCGSSREHAVWGLRELGIRCVIGTTFGGIFSDNCARNGIPAIALAPAEAERLMALAGEPGRCEMAVDLTQRTISTADGLPPIHFAFDPMLQHMLLEGLDAVGLTLESAADIRTFETRHLEANPWLRTVTPS